MVLTEAEFGTRDNKATSGWACGPQSLFSSAELIGLIKYTLSIKLACVRNLSITDTATELQQHN